MIDPKLAIRKAAETDMAAIFQLIVDLAAFEEAAHEVNTSVAILRRDWVADKLWFDCYVAEHATAGIVGIALYFYGYSTWNGRMLYLEDLMISQAFQRQGIGRALVGALVKEAQTKGVKQMRWQVLDWNESAIRMYKKIGAEVNGGWLNCSLDALRIEAWN